MDLNWLEDFLALAETRNFSRAAAARHVTQPAFSRRIQSLEAWVGTPLVTRSPQGVALNAAGEYLRAQAADIARDLHQARRGALKVAGRERAALAIAATHALSFTFFPSWIRAHAPLDSLGAINLVSDTMAACERILLAGDADFLLCHHHQGARWHFGPDRFRSIVVGTDVLVPVMAPGGAGGPTLPGSAAEPVRFLAYSAASGLGRILASVGYAPSLRESAGYAPSLGETAGYAPSLGESAGYAPGRGLWLDTVFTSPLAAALQTMVRQGHGIAWLPHSLAVEDLVAGRLVSAGGDEFSVPVEIRLFAALDPKSGGAEMFWKAVSAMTAPVTPRAGSAPLPR